MSKIFPNILTKYCESCEAEKDFESGLEGWYCCDCGRTDGASETYLNREGKKKSPNHSHSNNLLVDSYIGWGIKVALLIGCFPFSLLFLVLAYGMENSIEIIKNLIVTGLRSVALLIIFAIELLVLLIILVVIYQKITLT